jgi:glycosyltransferase involved in cell wall biosynthesis
MPTRDRRAFVPLAVAYFLRQDYEPKELVVVDDGVDALADLLPADPRIRYLRLASRATVGAKRNLACAAAHGTVVAHWDDDDWQAPGRLRAQVHALLTAGADLCGLQRLLFYSPRAARAWQYDYRARQPLWLGGSTLCYRRAFWAGSPFPALDIAEDAGFVGTADPARTLVLPDPSFHVGLIHGANVSPKQTSGRGWQPYPLDEIRRLLGGDWARYQDTRAW